MLSLGTLNFFLGVDTSGLGSALGQIRNFGTAVEQSQRAANKGLNSNIEAYRRQENVILASLGKLRTAQNQINSLKISPQAKLDGLQQIQSEFNRLAATIAKTGKLADATTLDRHAKAFANTVSRATQELRGMETASKAVETASKGIENQTLRNQRALAQAEQTARNLAASIERSAVGQRDATGVGPSRTAPLTDKLQGAFSGLQGALASPTLDTKGFQTASLEFKRQVGEVRRTFAGLKADFQAPVEGFASWQKGLHTLGSLSLLTSGHLGGLSTRMFAASQIVREYGVAAGAATTGIFLLAASLTNLHTALITTTLELDRSRKVMIAVFGDAQAAAAGFDFVIQVANKAGLEISATAQSFAKFSAAAKETALTAETTRDIFEKVSLTIGTLGLSVQDAQLVFLALEQMLSKGKVSTEELRRQLGERVPGAMILAAKALGVTTAELDKMLKKGEVISSDFLPKFADQLIKTFNIDSSKGIDNLQASLNRMSTSWTLFLDGINQSTGYSLVYKGVVEALTSALNSLTANLDEVFKALGAVAGALAALALLAVVPAMVSLSLAAYAGVAAFLQLAAGVRTLTQAMLLFEVVTTSTVVGLVLKLGVVLLGATLGYKMFEAAIEGATAAERAKALVDLRMAETTRIAALASGDLTKASKEERKAILASLQASRARAMQALATAKALLTEARASLAVAQANNKRELSAALKTTSGAGGGVDHAVVVANKYGKYITPAENAIGKAEEEYAKLEGILGGIDKAIADASKPINIPSPTVGGDDGKSSKAAKAIELNIDRVKDLKFEAEFADKKLKALFESPGKAKVLDDLGEATRLLKDLKPGEIALAAKFLNTTPDGLLTTVQQIITSTREANDEARIFTTAWDNISTAHTELKGMSKTLDYIKTNWNEGGAQGPFASLSTVESQLKAEKELAGLGIQALESLRKHLNALGFEGKTAHDALANFYDAAAKNTRAIQGLKQVHDMERAVALSLYESTAVLKGYSISANVGEGVEAMIRIRRETEAYRIALEEANVPLEEANRQAKEFEDSLVKEHLLIQQAEKVKAIAEQWRDAFRDMAKDMTSGIMDVIKGAKTLGEALTDVFMNFVNRVTTNLLDNLFSDLLDDIMGKDGALGIATSILGGGNSQKTAVNANTKALNALTAAIWAMSSGIGGGSSSSGGGLLGSILDIIVGAAGGGSSGGGGGGSDYDAFVESYGRARGGPGTRGNSYRVNETGTAGDLFIPGQSGQFVPLDQLGGGSTISIDARTTIDARGASVDAVQLLEARMRERDQQMRATLPAMIDARVQDSRMRLRGV